MSYTVFYQVNYSVDTLVDSIEMGVIGLPDIQRPFIWKNAKVRDLFDSMYRGYPVGYLLFWRNASTDDTSVIGVDEKQKTPSLLIVDGQQRLTSLFSVIRGIEIIREDYSKEKLKIAFDPLQEKFEVTDAAIQRDKSFIPDISILWSNNCDLFGFVDEYLKGVKDTHDITPADEAKIKKSITSLYSLRSFPLTALELTKDITEEKVAEVFVRINSKGTPLNQADFILTLMSVFWDDGRTQLEEFCKNAKQPSAGKPSPFNYYIKPSPDQLLRVCVGLAFKRARLQYIYSILRGKDLETEQFSDERRDDQFEILKVAQEKVLNLNYWHDYLKCIRMAGFVSGKLISSQANLLYTYVFYLMGRTEFKIDNHKLRKVIAQWFFMASLTGRYTGSAETAMESDLARFRGIKDGEEFLQILQRICDLELTDDYWKISLPNALATSSTRSPSLFAYIAALVLMDANALFSELKVTDLLDPTIIGHKSAAERHHLFPKGYLRKLNITDIRETNQIANFAYIEYGDNIKILDQAPSEYLPELKPQDKETLKRIYKLHALPENWELMDYSQFLEKRRELMAKIIYDGYRKLKLDRSRSSTPIQLTLAEMINNGETHQMEFKATLRTNLHTNQRDPKMEFTVMRTLAGFLNANGGILTIGVNDDGSPLGIEVDSFENEDKMALHLVNLVKSQLGITNMALIHIHFDDFENHRVLIVECSRAVKPVYMKDGSNERFFIRTGPSTTELSTKEAVEYIKERF
jgi:hypothetical protein